MKGNEKKFFSWKEMQEIDERNEQKKEILLLQNVYINLYKMS